MPENKISLSNQPTAEQGTVPSEAIAIPSEGMLYPPGHRLHQAQFVEIRPMTARDEDILTSRALFKSGRVIDTLLRSCVVDKDIDVSQLLSGDRNAIIIGIRVSGYGRGYQTRLECPSCGEKSDIEIDLGELPLKKLPAGAQPVAPFTNEFVFRGKKSGRTVHFRLPTGVDDQEMAGIIERMRKSSGAENLVTTRLMTQILSIDGETDRVKLAAIVRNLPARDSRDLRTLIEELSPDVRLISDFSCRVCGLEAKEISVPLGTEFFWPEA